MIRIAHLGDVDTFDTVVALSVLEMAMRKFGLSVEFGKGAAAAQEIPEAEHGLRRGHGFCFGKI